MSTARPPAGAQHRSAQREGTPVNSTVLTTRMARSKLLHRLFASGRVRTGLALTLVIVVVALLGPWLAPHGPTEMLSTPFEAPGNGMLLGTDALGRDVLSRFLHGGASLVWMSLAATAIGIGLGVSLGLMAAYAGHRIDEIIMRLLDVKLAFPTIVFSLLVVTMFGPGKLLLVLIVGISLAPGAARVTRGAAMAVVRQEYLQYARAIGLGTRHIIVRELLPNVSSPILVEAGLRMMWAISAMAGLSFLGYGIQPPESDWGPMINENRNALSTQPWAVVVPIAAIAVFTIGINLFADGVARAVARTDTKVKA